MGGLNRRSTFYGVWHVEFPIALAIFAAVAIALGIALIASRLRRHRPASQATSHPRLEVAYATGVAALAVFVIVLSLRANNRSDARPAAVQVAVTAFQWCWRFQYQGTPVTVSATCIGGDVPTLEVPTGQPVEIHLTSADVVHSMWVPYIRFKVTAFPNHVNTFAIVVPRSGTYPGRCAEYCGLYHFAMDFTVKAVPPATFQRWLHTQGPR